jgi:hypothetical protein
MLTKSRPEEARSYLQQAQMDAESRWHLYQYLASRPSAPGALTGNGGRPGILAATQEKA